MECIAEEGEVIFVPNGWWHMVVNLDDCIALTQNYCSTSNLSACLKFLREKTDQISGVRDRAEEAVQPEEMYDKLLQCLRRELPAEIVEKALADSFTSRAKVPKRKKAALSHDHDDDLCTSTMKKASTSLSNNYGNNIGVDVKTSITTELSPTTSIDDNNSPTADAATVASVDEASSFSFSFF
jgi:ribosomal protein L16 Arg81 hydroxylase